MEKISMIFLSLLVIVLMAGCGKVEEKEQELICTNTENEDGMIIEQVISMTYKNNKLKNMSMKVNTRITDTTIQENWEAFKEIMDEDNEEFDKDGIRLKVDTNDQTYEYSTTLDIDVEKASEEDLTEQGFEGLKDDESTIEDSKKEAEKDGSVCEIKDLK